MGLGLRYCCHDSPGRQYDILVDDKGLKVNLSLNWTGPYQILAVCYDDATESPDWGRIAVKLLFLNLPGDMPGEES